MYPPNPPTFGWIYELVPGDFYNPARIAPGALKASLNECGVCVCM